MIQFIGNVNQNGMCPLVPGDIVYLEVWNPQTMTMAKAKMTVAAN